MEYTLGYLKDCFALFYFSICAIKLGTTTQVSDDLRKELLTYFILGFCVDFSFSVHPKLHNYPFGYNRETYLFIGYFCLAVSVFLYYNIQRI